MEVFNVKTLVEPLGIKPNDLLFVSSDLSQIAKYCRTNNLKFDVNRFIDDLFDLVCDGTLVFPAYTDNLFNGDLFDHQKSKPTIGALSNRVFRRKDFERSTDALHSVFAKGKKAHDIIMLNPESTFGHYSVFGYLHQNNAKFLFVNVHIEDSLTFVHYVEEEQQVWYRRYYDLEINRKLNEVITSVKLRFYSKRLGFLTDFKKLNDLLVSKGLMKSVQLDSVNIDLLEVGDTYTEILGCIKSGPKLYRFSVLKFLKDFVKRYLLRRKGIL